MLCQTGSTMMQCVSQSSLKRWGARAFLVAAGFAAAAQVEPYQGPEVSSPAGIRGEIQADSWNIAAGGLNAMLPAFSDEYPNVKVRVNMSGAQLQTRFMLSLVAGVGAPDVSQLQLQEVPRYSCTGRLTDLTLVAEKYRDAFPENVWKDCIYEGRIYAIPWDIGPCAVFYKRNLFEKYGVDANAIQTWDDYIAAGERLLQASGGKTKMLFYPTGFQEILFEMLLRQSGGQVFDESGRIAVNSPESLAVLGILRRFVKTGISANTQYWSQPFFASFNTESVATYRMAVWFGGFIRDYAPCKAGEWGGFELPALTPGGLRTSSYGGSALVIPAQCEQKDAAWAFIEFALCRRDSQLSHYRSFGLFPAMTTVYDDPFFDEHVEYFGGQQVRRLFTKDVERIPAMNRTKDWEETRSYLRQSLGHWASEGMENPGEFLSALEVRLARRLDRELSPQSLSLKGGTWR